MKKEIDITGVLRVDSKNTIRVYLFSDRKKEIKQLKKLNINIKSELQPQ